MHRSGGLVSLCALFLCLPHAAAADLEAVSWKGYQEARDEARQRKAPLFLFFYTHPCHSCTKMELDTLRDDGVVGYLGDHFVSVRVDSSHSRFLSRKYAVPGIPTSLFLTPLGERINFLPGYVEPPAFLSVLKYIGEGHYHTKTLAEYLRDP